MSSHPDCIIEPVKTQAPDGRQWLTPVILTTQEAEIRRNAARSQPEQIVHETLFRKTLHKKKERKKKIGLVQWLKAKALSSSLSTTKKKKKKEQLQARGKKGGLGQRWQQLE
jgi:hypothetical protein